ncbi:MBL fold metallo-hydrolase [Cohnella sp. WQ 127256]|uniref:MBL fold metallo-hydrolase n=1 Tax=Cohnella sp. WQ 127256 TaxID=2938790 RepID=UPI002117DDFA|nr:MBL fold metallo-hydrolase [Cohnella sp. WQ 127256]
MIENVGLKKLSLVMNLPNEVMVVNPVLLWGDKNAYVLVDTGMPGQLEALKQCLWEEELTLNDLDAILFTHQDIDHIGNLPHLLSEREGERPAILAHEADKPYIDGSRPLLKFNPQRYETLLQTLDEKDRNQFLSVFSPSSSNNVTHLVKDGDFLPYGGGITIIHTPGHTPGHISFYHHASRTLVTGDAMVVVNGQLFGPEARPTLNMEEALHSLHKFTEFDISTVICYHGGFFEDRPNERIREIIAEAGLTM